VRRVERASDVPVTHSKKLPLLLQTSKVEKWVTSRRVSGFLVMKSAILMVELCYPPISADFQKAANSMKRGLFSELPTFKPIQGGLGNAL
jgi:hypothetical protein